MWANQKTMKIKSDKLHELQLLKALSEGNLNAYEKLFKLYYPILYAYAHKFLEKEDAQEIAQDTLIWLWENRSHLSIDRSLTSYLFSMIHNRSLNLIAKKEAMARVETTYYSLYQTQIEDFSLWQIRDLMENVDKAIARLPEDFRNAFVLSKFKGMSVQEIAELYSISPKTVYYRIQQAMKILKVELKDYLPLIQFLFIGSQVGYIGDIG